MEQIELVLGLRVCKLVVTKGLLISLQKKKTKGLLTTPK